MESIWIGKYQDYFLQCMLIVDRLERLSVTKEEFLILKALVNTIITIIIITVNNYHDDEDH